MPSVRQRPLPLPLIIYHTPVRSSFTRNGIGPNIIFGPIRGDRAWDTRAALFPLGCRARKRGDQGPTHLMTDPITITLYEQGWIAVSLAPEWLLNTGYLRGVSHHCLTFGTEGAP